MKFFNTAGPVNQPDHYKIDPLHRWDLEEILGLIAQRKYFILHAPRQTGKTSSLLALQDYLNKEGRYLAIYVNIEGAQAARHDVANGIRAVVGAIVNRLVGLEDRLVDYDPHHWVELADEHAPQELLSAYLQYLTSHASLPIVLLVDEIDALIGDTLVSVLRQLRGAYDTRPTLAPSTVVLCGVRDIRDYRIHRSNDAAVYAGDSRPLGVTADQRRDSPGHTEGGYAVCPVRGANCEQRRAMASPYAAESAFNIKSKSLRLGSFTPEEVVALYAQHTAETGQCFEEGWLDLVWESTEGQPWLVNALAHEVTWETRENRDRSVTITKEMLAEAKERLILSRQTHLDQLADKLKEPRVQRVILPLILGDDDLRTNQDDGEYCIDLGLVTIDSGGLRIANAIYKEVIPRELTEMRQVGFLSRFSPEWIRTDGTLDTELLFTLLQDFWRENADIWASHIEGYQEAAPQLVTQAFLQRVANGSGRIDREYGLGRRRTDILMTWRPSAENAGADGRRPVHRYVVEIKTIRPRHTWQAIREEALKQTTDYGALCAAEECHLLVFDCNPDRTPEERIFREEAEHAGRRVMVWGM